MTKKHFFLQNTFDYNGTQSVFTLNQVRILLTIHTYKLVLLQPWMYCRNSMFLGFSRNGIKLQINLNSD